LHPPIWERTQKNIQEAKQKIRDSDFVNTPTLESRIAALGGVRFQQLNASEAQAEIFYVCSTVRQDFDAKPCNSAQRTAKAE